MDRRSAFSRRHWTAADRLAQSRLGKLCIGGVAGPLPSDEVDRLVLGGRSATRPTGMPRSGHCSSAATKASEANLGEPDVSDQASQRRARRGDSIRERLDASSSLDHPCCFRISSASRASFSRNSSVYSAPKSLGEDGSHFEHLASAELGIGGAPLGPLEASSSELTSTARSQR